MKDTYCISIRKLPLALAKLNITPKMKREQPELSQKLELYQDKCSDVLATVFIDGKSTSDINIQPIVESLNTFTNTVTSTLSSINERISNLEDQFNKRKLPEKKYSRWKANAFNKLYKLQEFVNENSEEQLSLPNIIHLIIKETEDI